jgi:hypothetical protein
VGDRLYSLVRTLNARHELAASVSEGEDPVQSVRLKFQNFDLSTRFMASAAFPSPSVLPLGC